MRTIRPGLAILLSAGLLAGCSGSGSAPAQSQAQALPFNVDGGIGSQYGNYAEVRTGGTLTLHGRPCTVFNWDRPYAPGLAVRTRSASCPSDPGSRQLAGATSVELDRQIIPLSQSNLSRQQP